MRPATALKAGVKAVEGTDGPLVEGASRVSMRPPNRNASPITSLPWLGMVKVVRYP